MSAPTDGSGTVTEILRLEQATIVSPERGRTALWAVDLTIRSGELALVFVGTPGGGSLLGDACTGLVPLSSGSVRIMGREWSTLSPDRACAMRGRTRRVFDGQNWINYASVGENMMMCLLHHTKQRRQDIFDEAVRMSREFGLPGLPTGRADTMLASDLRRAACARAFIGAPDLVFLESPTRDAYPSLMGPLANAVNRVRKRGGAVIWTTDRDEVWNDRAIRPSIRARVSGSQFVVTDSEA